MPRTTHITRWLRRPFQAVAWLIGALLLAGAAGAAPTPDDRAGGASAGLFVPAPTSYRVVNLAISGPLTGLTNFNSRDQFAISMLDANDFSHAYFYDGATLRTIPGLGGVHTTVTGINQAGQVAGYASLPGLNGLHAFRWSLREGIRDLGALSATGASYSGFVDPVNERGDVAGYAVTQDGQTHAFRWTPAEGMRDLGGLPGNPAGFSVAHLINNDGMVAGHGTAASGTQHAFTWTRREGMVEINTSGSAVANLLSETGRVTGIAFTASGPSLYTWTRRDGVRYLGAAGYEEIFFYEGFPSSNGYFTVGLRRDGGNIEHPGFSLGTPTSGVIDLGTLGGPVAFATAVNDKAHVVGQSDILPAGRVPYIWSFREGMTRLLPRVHAPPGLVVDYPIRISDNGTILAIATNRTFVLLRPECRGCGPHGTADAAETNANH